MLKLLTALLSLLDRLFRNAEEQKYVGQGRLQAKAELDAHVEKAEAAVVVPDPERTQRLRNRFDAASGPE